jgi:DNA-directed RNA polymerase specialized sigma24 family protein
MFGIVLVESRRPAVAKPVLEAPARDVAPETGDGDPRTAAVRSALENLPARQREIAFLRYFADLDEASIAAALHRVRERVRQAIDDDEIASARA